MAERSCGAGGLQGKALLFPPRQGISAAILRDGSLSQVHFYQHLATRREAAQAWSVFPVAKNRQSLLILLPISVVPVR